MVFFDLETDTIIGWWNDYKDADQFWSDSMCGPDADEYNWSVFPTDEIDKFIAE